MHYLHSIIQTFDDPSSNYRGDSEGGNRIVLQKLTRVMNGSLVQVPMISSTAIRNGFREGLAMEGGINNRRRVLSDGPPTVGYQAYPDPNKYDDDGIMGYLVLSEDGKKASNGAPLSRHSSIGVTHALALNPYYDDAVMSQSPAPTADSVVKNSKKAALFHSEVHCSSFQYSWSLCVEDFGPRAIKFESKGEAEAEEDEAETKKKKAKSSKVGVGQEFQQDSLSDALGRLLTVIGDPPKIAGNHARNPYSFAPKNLLIRVTKLRNPQFERLSPMGDIFSRLSEDDLPPGEFWVAGDVVRKDKDKLVSLGVPEDQMAANPSRLLSKLFDKVKVWAK